MRILISAFACAPDQGSEPGLGWRWSAEAACLGHEVTVLTQSEHQAAIEAQRAAGRLPDNLHFVFFMPPWLDRLQRAGLSTGHAGLTYHLTHLLWQLLVYRFVRQNLDLGRFDCVHHLTYSGLRHPTLLGRLPLPLILGPLGGGERAPLALRRSLPLLGWVMDALRDLHTFSIRFDPITRRACADAAALYVKTEQSRQALPKSARAKARLAMEIGAGPVVDQKAQRRLAGNPLRLLYAGRFIYWKGMHLGLQAVASAVSQGAALRLTMLGRGPEAQRWRLLVRQLEIDHLIDWHPWVNHAQMSALYRAHGLFLFPSLHDSSGNAVLEALSHGLPVVCLDLGGPAILVNAACGQVIATAGRSEDQVVQDLAAALLELESDEEMRLRLCDGALARARAMAWSTLIDAFYEDAATRLQDAARSSAQPLRSKVEHGVEQATENHQRQGDAAGTAKRGACDEPLIEQNREGR